MATRGKARNGKPLFNVFAFYKVQLIMEMDAMGTQYKFKILNATKLHTHLKMVQIVNFMSIL